MNPKLKNRLDTKSWKVSSVEEFLGLTKEESAYVEHKLILSENLKSRRQKIKSARKAAK